MTLRERVAFGIGICLIVIYWLSAAMAAHLLVDPGGVHWFATVMVTGSIWMAMWTRAIVVIDRIARKLS